MTGFLQNRRKKTLPPPKRQKCRTVNQIISPGRSVYLHSDLLTDAGAAGSHNGADRLGDTSLLADNSAHIVGSDVQMINCLALLVGFIDCYFNSRRIVNEFADDSFQKLFHLVFLLVFPRKQYIGRTAVG